MPTQTPLVRYALDPTGLNVNNAVNGEVKSLTTAEIRAAAPLYGPYFTESLTVYDHSNNRPLVRGVDYQCVEMLQEATLRFGKEIAQLILIISHSVSNSIRINYQTLGGLYQNDTSGLVNLYNTFMSDDRPLDWSKVLNKPPDYTPSLHNHMLQDIVGFEPVVVALERIRNAIVLSDVPAFEALIDWVRANAGSAVMVEPEVPNVAFNDVKTFTVRTSNKRNGAKYFWEIEHHGTGDVNFTASTGSFTIFQNKATFTVTMSAQAPYVASAFDIIIRADSLNGPIVTTIEDILYLGLTNGNTTDTITMMDMVTSCCLYKPGMKVSAKSLFIIGDN